MNIKDIQMIPVSIPIIPIEEGGVAPYKGSQDMVGASTVSGCIFKVTTNTELVGWGEMNPVLNNKVMASILEDYIKPQLVGMDPFDIGSIMEGFGAVYDPQVNTRWFLAGIEMACWDLMGKATNQPIYKLLGGKVRDKIEIAYCFGITDIPTVQKKIQEIKDQGYLAFKTKGGRDVIFDIERTQAIREEAGKSMKLRVDMNQGYSLIDAITYVNGVSDCQLEYLEQPIRVNNIDSLASLRSRSTVPIAINEDCYIPNNFLETIKRNAIDVGVIDLEPLGGITELVKAAHIANEAGIPLAHHCGWDMGIKLAAVLQTVSSLAAFTQPMDSTYMAHADDVLKEKINVINGHYYPSTEPGLGIEVDEEKIAKYAV